MHPEQFAQHDSSARRFATLAADDITARIIDIEAAIGGAADAPTVVFLHGLTFNRGHWTPAIRALSDSEPGSQPIHRMIAFDLPGHGGSPAPDSYAMDDLAATLHAALDDAGVTDPVVVGHSAGAVFATGYALRYAVRGVVNVDQPLRASGFATLLQKNAEILNGPQYLQVWNMLLGGMHIDLLAPDVRPLVTDAPMPARELLLGYWSELMNTAPAELDEHWLRQLAVLRKNQVPYRHIAGAALEPAYEQWLRAALPEVEITVLPGSGHFPHLADPAGTAAVVRAAVATASGAPTA